MHKTLENNWSRSVLLNFLDTDLYERQGYDMNNFVIEHFKSSMSTIAEIENELSDK